MYRKTSVFLINTIFLFLLLTISSCNNDEALNNTSPIDVKKQPTKERLYAIKEVKGNTTKAVAPKDKTWEIGETIKIKFLNGSPALQERVKQCAATWLEHANLKFEYVNVNDNADVKIGFEYGDDFPFITWSTIGTDCKLVPQDEASTNFVWLEDEADDDFFRSEVLRGFGHIIGLGFENRNPNSPIEFKYATSTDKRKLEGHFGMSIADIMQYIIPLYQQDQTNYTEYDAASIMLLPLPGTILTNPRLGTIPNIELSETDKAFVADLYPKRYLKYVDFGHENQLLFDVGWFASVVQGLTDDVVYSFTSCGIFKVDLSNRTFKKLTSIAMYRTFRIDDRIYMGQSNSSTTLLEYIDLNTDQIHNTNVAVGDITRVVKNNSSGTTYFGTFDNGLFYLDNTDGLVKRKNVNVDASVLRNGLGNDFQVRNLLNKEDGTVYFTATQNTPCYTYLFHIDANDNINYITYLPSQSVYMESYPGRSKIYTNYSRELQTPIKSYNYIDENHNFIKISDNWYNNGGVLFIGANDMLYARSGDTKKVGVLKNGQFVDIPMDPPTKEQMGGIYGYPLENEMFWLSGWTEQPTTDSNSWIWWTDLFYMDYDNSYIKRLPTKNISIGHVFETPNGNIYCVGYYYDRTIRSSGLWQIMK